LGRANNGRGAGGASGGQCEDGPFKAQELGSKLCGPGCALQGEGIAWGEGTVEEEGLVGGGGGLGTIVTGAQAEAEVLWAIALQGFLYNGEEGLEGGSAEGEEAGGALCGGGGAANEEGVGFVAEAKGGGGNAAGIFEEGCAEEGLEGGAGAAYEAGFGEVEGGGGPQGKSPSME